MIIFFRAACAKILGASICLVFLGSSGGPAVHLKEMHSSQMEIKPNKVPGPEDGVKLAGGRGAPRARHVVAAAPP
jgi:hypothetical protein